MAATEYLKVDFERLKALIEFHAGNISKAEKALGCGHAISNARRNGMLAKPVVYAIESEYGIAYDDYTSEPPYTVVDIPESYIIIRDAQWQMLGEVIYQFVKKAIKDAFEETDE